MESILTSIKRLLGVEADYTHFDTDIMMHINSVFFVLYQLGVHPDSVFSITDSTTEWSHFTLTSLNLEVIKSYMYLKVRLLFDPPLSTALIQIMKDQIAELEFRIMIEVDPKPIPVPVINYNEEGILW